MILAIDIDNTICTPVDNADYMSAKPYKDKIAIINELYNKGHYIIYYSARGCTTGLNWHDSTKEQLDSWGCLYNELNCTKIYYDLQIDDKTLNSLEFFTNYKLLKEL